LTIAEVGDIVPAGALDPDLVMTPGIFVQRVVRR
jgi:3-oxoadipate CoA-transferase alpha subunit